MHRAKRTHHEMDSTPFCVHYELDVPYTGRTQVLCNRLYKEMPMMGFQLTPSDPVRCHLKFNTLDEFCMVRTMMEDESRLKVTTSTEYSLDVQGMSHQWRMCVMNHQ